MKIGLISPSPAAILPSVVRASTQSGRRVELDCKIVASAQGFHYKSWIVEIRKSNGEPLRQLKKEIGETARFKGLEPGIYVLCLTGSDGSGRCESVDLNPSDNRSNLRLKMNLGTPTPSLNSIAGHRISVAQLGIPKEARIEMTRSDNAALHGNTAQMVHHLERALKIYPSYPSH